MPQGFTRKSSSRTLQKQTSREEKAVKGFKSKNDKKIQRKISNNLYQRYSQINDESMQEISEEPMIDMDEEMPPRSLYTDNPAVSRIGVRYNYLTRDVNFEELFSTMVVHFEAESTMVPIESDEYKLQEEIVDERNKQLKEVLKGHEISNGRSVGKLLEDPDTLKLARKIIRNKFNYEEAGVQCPTRVIRERGVSTTKASLRTFNCEVNQADIYEAYMEHSRQNKKDRLQEIGLPTTKAGNEASDDRGALVYSKKFNRCLRTMERMIVQNNEEQKYKDYRYMFTENDTRPIDKSLFPLWRFVYAPNKKHNVTSVVCSPRYPDMFAVSYGSYEFGKRVANNVITLFTFKNTNYPEVVIPVEDAVMSLDFHPTSPALLCVGLYNGNVMVFDVRTKNKQPIYKSSIRSKKHTDPVWQVKWSPDSQKYNFYSISSDGRVLKWILMKDQLECEEVFKLKYVDKKSKNKEDETSLTALSCGLCFDFSPFDQFSFIVGTEEGNIHRCSTAYSGDYQMTYEGHKLAVYRIKYHPYDSETFISASADWSVKVWNINIQQALMTFELGQAVVDVVWSPFSASVFVALSLDKTYVFDFKENRHMPIFENKPVRSKCTNLAINWKDPIVFVGDSHGGVSTFKISKDIADPNVDMKNDHVLKKQVQEFKEYLKLGSMVD